MAALQIADLNNAKVDVDHIADIANSLELTATDRLGNTKQTIAGIIADLNAEVAMTETAENRAAAELARDVALALTDPYDTESAGRAAVANGVLFSVIGSGDVAAYVYRRVDSSSSSLVTSFPSTDAVAEMQSDIDHITEPLQALDFNVPSTFAIAASPGFTSPTNYSTLVVADEFKVTSNTANVKLIGVIKPASDLTNSVVEIKARITVNNNVQDGITLGINPGSTSVLDATTHISIMYRLDGAMAVYRRDGTTSVASVLPGGGVFANVGAYVVGDEISMQLKYGDDLDTPDLSIFVNDVLRASGTLSNVPTGYPYGSIRCSGSGSIGFINQLSVTPKSDQDRRIYLNGLSSPGGRGTEASPFDNIQSAAKYIRESAGNLDVLLKGGIYRGTLILPSYNYRKIRVRGSVGDTCEMRASTLRTSGWTQHGTHTNLWYRDHVFGGFSPSSSTAGTIIDVTPAHAVSGLSHRIYTRIAPDTALATLNATTAGCSMVDTVNKRMYTRPYNDASPNTLSLEISDYGNVLAVPWAASGSNFFADVVLENITFRHAYSDNVSIEQAFVRMENCESYGSGLGGGFKFADVRGDVSSLISNGNFGDGFSASAAGNAIGSPQTPANTAYLTLNDCVAKYQQGAGDGASNHSTTKWIFRGGEFSYNAKDGIVAGNFDAFNVVARGNADKQIYWGSFSADYVAAGGRAFNCVVDGLDLTSTKRGGFYALVGALGDRCDVEIYGGQASNCSQAIATSNALAASKCIVTAYNVLDAGGNTALTNNSGGTLNAYSKSAIT